MATKFTAFIWPPLIFPTPLSFGKIGPTFNGPASYPPLLAPTPLNPTKIGQTFNGPATFPPLQIPTSPSASVNFTPPAAQPVVTTYVDPNVTAQGTRTFFHIILTGNGLGS